MGRDGSGGFRSIRVSRRARRGALLFGGLLSLVLAATAFAAIGDLTQKPGAEGCVTELAVAGTCTDGTALNAASSMAVSADGAHAYVTSASSDAVAIFDRNTTTGTLTQKPGTAGCISDDGTGGACVNGRALEGAQTVVLSPDGLNAYVASVLDNSVAVFDRNPTTGELTQKAAAAGCISETGTGPCADGVALDRALDVAISPDGASVYVASEASDAVAIFDRTTSTGALTQKPGTAGCISEDGTGGACFDGRELDGANGVTVFPDGTGVYATAGASDAVTIFDRGITTGALTQRAGTAGCISEDGSGGTCADGTALDNSTSLAISPNGASAYVASSLSNSLAIFDRNLATGALTQKAGTAGCISDDGTGAACVDGTALIGAQSVTSSPDGASVYVAAGITSNALAIFERNAATGALTQRAGTAGCISDDGTGGACVDGRALDYAYSVTVSPGGGNVYVASFNANAVAIFDRELAAPPDTTSPDLKITKKPKKKVKTKKKRAKVKVSFSSEPEAEFECKIDKGIFKPCSSPFKAKLKSARGKGKKHTISIFAYDVAGNSSEPETVSTKVIRKKKK